MTDAAILPLVGSADLSPLTALVGVLLSGGFLGALAVYIRAKPEAEGVAVKTMAYTLQVVRGDMEAQERKAKEREAELLQQIAALQRRVDELENRS